MDINFTEKLYYFYQMIGSVPFKVSILLQYVIFIYTADIYNLSYLFEYSGALGETFFLKKGHIFS